MTETTPNFTLEELRHLMLDLNSHSECELCSGIRHKLEKMIENHEEKPVIEERIIVGHKVTVEHFKGGGSCG